MPHHWIRERVRKLVASGGLLLGSARVAPGCCPPMAEPIGVERVIDPRGVLATAVAECRADDLACTKLCTQVFFDGALPERTSILACTLHDRTPAESRVQLEYIVYEPCEAGRRPPGLLAPARVDGDPVGRWLAAAAHLEAASVPAFVLLARDLIVHRAPAVLVRAALAAAGDEVRHAAVMSALARGYGVTPPPVELVATPVRSLVDLALDNAVEGCVREAFAAACAAHQARAAVAELRAPLAAIAVDEARHAALAFALDGWLASRLGVDGRRARTRARTRAFDELWAGADAPPAGADRLGWPSPRRARALLTRLPA